MTHRFNERAFVSFVSCRDTSKCHSQTAASHSACNRGQFQFYEHYLNILCCICCAMGWKYIERGGWGGGSEQSSWLQRTKLCFQFLSFLTLFSHYNWTTISMKKKEMKWIRKMKKKQVIQNVDSASSSSTPTTSISVNAYNCSGDASAVLFGGETTNGAEKKERRWLKAGVLECSILHIQVGEAVWEVSHPTALQIHLAYGKWWK